MKVKVCGSYESMSRAAAGCMARDLERNPRLLVCLATGATPVRTYELLGSRARQQPGLFQKLRALKLDEWDGLPMNAPGTCETYLRHYVLGPWRVSQGRYTGFVTDQRQPQLECKRIHNWLARNGPIDLCILGLGRNGHLGLNEPGPALFPFAHRARLMEQTKTHSMLSDAAVKPGYGLTLGMAEILQARKILLLVSGASKRKALQRLLRGEVSTEFPASLLNLHPETLVLCDREASTPEPVE